MPKKGHKMTKKHKEAISRANKGHEVSEETKKKIGDANRKQVYFDCDYCGKKSSDRPSHYRKKKKHFCSMKCYAQFRKEKIPFWEQPSYKGIRKKGKTKSIYWTRYRKSYPKRIAHLKARRYARERGAKGNHTFEEWENLKKQYNYKCAICGKKTILTKDHLIPLSEGGTDYIQNIQPLCRSCNSKKWKKLFNK